MRQLSVLVVFLTILLAIGLPSAWGQEGAGSITGTVADPSGALIPDVQVTVTNTGTGVTRAVQTARDGTYVVPLLPPGNYTVTVSKSGFETVTQSGIIVAPDQAAAVAITMKVGSVTTTVQVSANAEMVTTTGGEIGQLINRTGVTELPLDGRSPSSLVFLAPGSTNGLTTSGYYIQYHCCVFPTETDAAINGGRMGSVLYLLNGTSNNDSWEMTSDPFPNTDATAEFQVITNNYGPEYGFASGGVVSIVTNSGTNSWHGNVFEFLRNEDLNAKAYFTHVVDPLKRNQPGGSLGGKLIRDKLFLFGNYQSTIDKTANAGTTNYVPTPAMYGGDFSALLSKGIQLYDPTGAPYPNNYIDPTTFNPVTLKIYDSGGTTPHFPTAINNLGYSIIPPIIANDSFWEFTFKTDYYSSAKDHFAFSNFVDHYLLPAQSGGGDLALSRSSIETLYQSHSVNWVRNISPNLLNNFIFGYNRLGNLYYADMIDSTGQGANFPRYGMQIAEFNKFPTDIDGWYVNGAEGVGANNLQQPRYNLQFNERVTWTKGKHLVIAGVDILRQDLSEATDYLARPGADFTGQYTGYGIADALTGRLYYLQMAGGEIGTVFGTQYGFYGGDTFHLKPNFTLDLGLRFEPFFPATVAGGRLTDFRPGQQSTRYPNAPVDEVFPGDTGIGPGGYPHSWNNLLPRVGIAWQPKFLHNTSMRAAFGIFMQPNAFSDYAHTWDGSPFSPEYIPEGGPGHGQFLDFTAPFAGFAPTHGICPYTSVFQWSPAVPPSNVPFETPFALEDVFGPTFKMGKINTWNVSIEHQFTPNMLVRVAYVGSEGEHLENVMEENPGYYSAGGARLNFPTFASILEESANSTASYNGLEFTFEKRFSHGIQFTSNYTWSKNIDSNSVMSTAWTGSVGDPFDLRWNRGLSGMQLPYMWSSQGVYRLPALAHSNAFMRGVLGSWQVSGIFVLQAGPPFDISGGYGSNQSLAYVGGDRADLTGQPFNVHQGSKSQWLQQYFNPAAFQPNAPGTFGDSARNIFEAPRLNNIDMGIFKNIPFKERYSLQLRLEMFNAFNYVQFAAPGTDPSNPISFGVITNQAAKGEGVPGSNRVMQLGAKITF
jgi:hypothetical protein